MGGIKYGAMDKIRRYKYRWLPNLIIVGLFLGIAIFVKTNFEVRANITNTQEWIFNPTTNHDYKVVTGCAGWHDCEQIAENEWAHLVTVNDSNEQDWLVATFGSYLYYGIGYTDEITEANWVWISGETASYTNWNEGEPSNSGDYGEHYAVMNWAEPGKWNDVAEGEVYWGIIERNFNLGWNYNPTTHHYYKVFTDCSGWHNCEQKANSEGAHLVTINDASEQDWLVATFGSDLHYGIGYTDEVTEANWVWISGESATYTNWNEGEPNNTDNIEHYAIINWEEPGKWNDIHDEGVTSGIIERTISFGWFYNPTTSHYYKLATGCSGWQACEAIAENEGAHLVTVNDSNEQDWLVATFSGNILYWLGFHDENHEAQWDWISGESVTYTNWYPGEPSNSYDNENYALMNYLNPGKWNDIAENYLAAGIIERNDAPVKVFIPILLR